MVTSLASEPYVLVGLPELKRPDAYGFPLTRLGAPPADDVVATRLVVACDRLLESITGAPCGGAAEEALVAGRADWVLVERFDASPRTVISIYSKEEP